MTIPHFRCISIDPPWPERGGCNRGADAHYNVTTVAELPRIIQAAPLWRPETSSHLWMWATLMHLESAVALMKKLGFPYKTHLVWVKTKRNDHTELAVGLGQYVRGSHELLLLGTRGKAMVPAPENRHPSVVFAPRGKHSAKPDAVVARMELVSPGPRAELFARQPRPGWWTWGNEIDGEDDILQPL
jgi:N6-adenosine-specific RNA methylase IME4